MRKLCISFCMLLIASVLFYSCEQSQDATVSTKVSADVLSQLVSLGFDVTDRAPFKVDNGYLVEGDIFLTSTDLSSMKKGERVPEVEQYSTNNLVKSLPRNITVFIPSTFSSTYVSAVDVAIARYNALGLSLTFSRVNSGTGAGISFVRLSRSLERQGVLGSSGFPTASGNPFNQIQMSGILQSTYGLSVNGIATIMAHEMGHCIGFRHTDFFDRSISCGGATSNEGVTSTGANLIPGTPSGATLAGKSWMLACTDGGDRPFNADDKVALNFLY